MGYHWPGTIRASLPRVPSGLSHTNSMISRIIICTRLPRVILVLDTRPGLNPGKQAGRALQCRAP